MTEFENSKRSLHLALERINNEIPFVFHYVTSDFCPTSSFSRVEFQLAVHSDGVRRLALNFNTLFKVEAKPEYSKTLKFIHNSRSHQWPPFHADPNYKQSEKSVMLGLCSEILLPLCREVILERRYHMDLSKWPMISGLECSDIGMGSINTWHGTPDVRVRGGTEVVHRKEAGDTFVVDEDGSDNESVSSDGMTTTVEGKVVSTDANLPQLISTCVVSSFTEKSLHPKKSALVPTILIDEKVFRVCLYDSEKDVLLISDMKLLTTNSGLSSSGMALLWVVLNHRLFLQQVPDDYVSKYPAGIKSRLEASGVLQHFISLKDKNCNWDMVKTPKRVHNHDLPVGFLPPIKKKKPAEPTTS